MAQSLIPAGDDLLLPSPGRAFPPRWYDRVALTMHTDIDGPYLVVASSLHPGAATAWVRVTLVDERGSRTVRMSADIVRDRNRVTVGPLTWDAVEPWQRWRLRLDENPGGVSFDIEWVARSGPWRSPLRQLDDAGGRRGFAYAFQSGICSGWTTFGTRRIAVDGWYGQRERSRGLRPPPPNQGLELRVAGEFPERTVTFAATYDTDDRLAALHGAIVPLVGTPDPIVEVRHDLRAAADGHRGVGVVSMRTASGLSLLADVEIADEAHDLPERAGLGEAPYAPTHPLADRRARFHCSRGLIADGFVAIRRRPDHAYRPTADPPSRDDDAPPGRFPGGA